MQTYHIHINGIVQGVGFRPIVYQLAKEMQLNGYVKNGSDGLHVFFNASEDIAGLFFEKIKEQAPADSKIISSELLTSRVKNFADFSIVVEEDDKRKNVLISPDKAICDKCREELYSKNNRRYRYPFITCTQCGPRYSIMKKVPYERQDTSMEKFSMCVNCLAEYNNVFDRRFFSQTNSCNDCGVELRIWENPSSILSKNPEKILSNIKDLLKKGKIIAVKGIGGYLLLCDANNVSAIQLLRNRKHRPAKPFALLYPGIETAGNHFELNRQEELLLQSKEAPIILLHPGPEAIDNLALEIIAPGLERLGIMLPYSPLLDLLSNDYGKPLVATSANISGSPIIYKDKDALDALFQVADYIISYNRDIIIPQDDTVVQFSRYSNRQIILRRSRGYAPSFMHYKPKKKLCVLSTGAFLKSSFTLSANGNVFVSQFLGSGESYESQQMYRNTLEHWLQLCEVKPEVIIADSHPGYFSHQYGIELSEKYGTGIKFIQHHEAHFAAVLAENNLIHSTEPVLGIIWDGTGLGSDGNIWGGEFFKYENNEILRCYHFDYFPAIAGDKMATEPRIAALSVAGDATFQPDIFKEKFTGTELKNYQSLIHITKLFSSSLGRIFDAVASLLDVCDKQTYEGEAAMYVQVMAEVYVTENGFVMDGSYFKEALHHYGVSTVPLVQGMIMDIKKGKSKNYIAAKFHYSLVCLIDVIAKKMNVEKICCSGGVFQNALLTDWIQKVYDGEYQLYFHQNLSPNDENISFGQFVYYDNNMRSNKENSNNNKTMTENLKTNEAVNLRL